MSNSASHIAPTHTKDVTEAFEAMYIAVRDAEGRLYTDKQVAHLPQVDTGHRYYKEWKMRKFAVDRLVTFLGKQRKSLNILEVGCGNGWLSAKLAGIPKARVTGIDPNRIEVEQARRVFKKKNLSFIHAPFNDDTFGDDEKFDVIIFAASVQYFPSLKAVMDIAFKLLNTSGRVHIMDTHFYHTGETKVAAERSMEYFTTMRYPEMAQYYFHHPLKEALHFKHKVMFNPTTFLNSLFKKSIFYWLKLKP